jgi:hypothetical protein
MLVEVEGESHRKLVKQLKTQTLDSARMLLRVCGKTAAVVQIKTWADDIKGRSWQFVSFMWDRTFESPMRVKTRGGIDVIANFVSSVNCL